MLILTINIEGKTLSDLEIAIDEVKKHISNGCVSGMDSNNDGEFNFQITGDEERESD